MFISVAFLIKSNSKIGRAIAQAVSRRLRTAVAQVRAHVRSCGICGGQSCIETGFLRILRFPLPILIASTAPYSSSIIRGWYNTPVFLNHLAAAQYRALAIIPGPRLIKKNLLRRGLTKVGNHCNRPGSGRRTKWTQSHPTPRN
jgi:hypothetical protein